MHIGYARVSTSDQNLNLQIDALKSANCEQLFTDVASGVKSERAGLDEAIKTCRNGDTIQSFFKMTDKVFSISRERHQ